MNHPLVRRKFVATFSLELGLRAASGVRYSYPSGHFSLKLWGVTLSFSLSLSLYFSLPLRSSFYRFRISFTPLILPATFFFHLRIFFFLLPSGRVAVQVTPGYPSPIFTIFKYVIEHDLLNTFFPLFTIVNPSFCKLL